MRAAKHFAAREVWRCTCRRALFEAYAGRRNAKATGR